MHLKHRWVVLPDPMLPGRFIRRCTLCAAIQQQVTGLLWGYRWFALPPEAAPLAAWRDATLCEWKAAEEQLMRYWAYDGNGL